MRDHDDVAGDDMDNAGQVPPGASGDSGYTFFGRPVTWEEIREIRREQAERLDPANRPVNAEVDNTTREWDYELNDFKDRIVGGRPRELTDPSKRPPIVDRPGFRRLLGTAMTAALCGVVALVWAVFDQQFTEFDNVTVTGVRSGLSLPSNADVKLRGMIVGEVRETTVENGQVKLTLGMNPELIDKVPAGVGARIVPKTLFGEKIVDLVPPEHPVGGSLKAGDVITEAVVPVEFEEFFNDIYPLLTAVPPEKVAATLTALERSLDGRGEELGQTLVLANEYLQKLAPETTTAVDDLVALGRVSDAYGGQMDELGALLTNASDVSRTVIDLDDELPELLDETTTLAHTLRRLFAGIGDDLIATAQHSRQPLAVLREYSSTFPCLLRGTETLTEQHIDDVMENGFLHIQLELISPQPTRYSPPERPTIPTESAIEDDPLWQPDNHEIVDGVPALGAVCDQMNAAAAGDPQVSHANPLKMPPRLWQLFGVQNSHNGKLGTDADYGRPASGAAPDVASLLLTPVLHGAVVDRVATPQESLKRPAADTVTP